MPRPRAANVLDALPKRLQPRAKGLLHEMAEAPSRADAREALEAGKSERQAPPLRSARTAAPGDGTIAIACGSERAGSGPGGRGSRHPAR